MSTRNRLIFCYPGYEKIANVIAARLGAEQGDAVFRHFPDGESYVHVKSDVSGRVIIFVCGLDDPDSKIMSLLYFSTLMRDMGAGSLILVAPYLGYMRQDKQFKKGEAITSGIFARLLGQAIDGLITVDPHLHRYHSLDELYSVPSRVVCASGLIARWIKNNVERPILIGPDEESEQWVQQVAEKSAAPYLILRKLRRGDRDVEISVPQVDKYLSSTPVLVDDIISTARTMIGTVGHILKAGMRAPICIGTHAIFAGDAFDQLKASGTGRVVTCDSICHETNSIELGGLIADQLDDDFASGFFGSK